jgi:hypothetical protein
MPFILALKDAKNGRVISVSQVMLDQRPHMLRGIQRSAIVPALTTCHRAIDVMRRGLPTSRIKAVVKLKAA